MSTVSSSVECQAAPTPADLAVACLQAAASICKAVQSPSPIFTHEVVTAAKTLTHASWVELLLLQDDHLVVAPIGKELQNSMRQTRPRFQVSEGSLAGLVAITGEPKNFTSPNTSAFYKNSSNRLIPFSPVTLKPEDTWAVAALPLNGDNAERLGVLLLFNKSEAKAAQSFFTSTDISTCSRLCEVIGSVIQTRKTLERLKSELSQAFHLLDEQNRIQNSFVTLYGQKKRLNQVAKTVKSEAVEVTLGLIEVLATVLYVDAILVHTVRNGKTEPRLAFGLELEDYHTNTSAYCGNVMKDVLMIRDVSTEPLLVRSNIAMKSALCCPLLQNGEIVAVFEFFRKSNSINEMDLRHAQKLLSSLQHISIRAYQCHLPTNPAPNARTSLSRSLSHYLSEFSLPRKNELFDYVVLLNHMEANLKQTFRCASANIYICDEAKNLIWTRKSESCDPLIFERDPDSLLGFLSYKATPTPFPLSEALRNKVGGDSYANMKGLCVPIKSEFTGKEQVFGIALLNTEKELPESEVTSISRYLEAFTRILAVLYFDRSFKTCKVSHRQINRRRSSFLELNIEETVLEKEKTEGKLYRFSSEEQMNPVPLLRLLPYLSEIPGDTLTRIGRLCATMDGAARPLQILTAALSTILPCESAHLLLFDSYRKVLIDQETDTQITPTGLVKSCLSTKSSIVIPSNVESDPRFDSNSDRFGLSSIKSVVIIPISCYGNQENGVLLFANLQEISGNAVVHVAELLACIPRDIIIATDDTVLNWRNLMQTERRQKMLFRWCGEIFRVMILSQERTFKCSSIQNRLKRSLEVSDLLAITLETIALILNAEGAKLIIRHPGTSNFSLFTVDSALEPMRTHPNTTAASVFQQGTVIITGKNTHWENAIAHPILQNHETVAVLEIWNKKDDVLSSFLGFSGSDEAIIGTLAQHLAGPCLALVDGSASKVFPELVVLLKEGTWAINNYSLLSTIRRACKTLLDCDRASVFLVEGDQLVIKPQGNDSEIPVGISIPIGMGIIGSVAQTCQSCNLEDVYADPRFNPSIDIKTGYRTRTMLCAPVLAKGKAIAALQMINKNSGFFDATDIEILEMISELASGALQSMQLFQALNGEKKLYTDIINSLGCVIIVLTEGKLDYSNRSITDLLGISEPFALTHHYSQWPKISTTLKSDLDAVKSGRANSVRKKFQSIVTDNKIDRKFDYKVLLFDEEDISRAKMIILLEEVGTDMQKRSPGLNARQLIKSETKLQACIEQIVEVMHIADQDVKDRLEFVVNSLKSGNLNQTRIILDEESLAKSIDPEILMISPPSRRLSDSASVSLKTFQIAVQEFSQISIEALRDWNLDLSNVSDLYPYIIGMLEDFNFLQEYSIDLNTFRRFLDEIRSFYNRRSNPFHNFTHASTVMHNVYCVLTGTSAGGFFDNWELFALLLAALGHDVDHTGRSNSFETTKESILALRYHDTSVLEQHHAAMLFLTLQNPRYNFLINMDPGVKKDMRKLMISVILATDMSKHMPMVTNMMSRFSELHEHSLGSRPNDKREVGELIIHCADLSNQTKPFEVSYKWSSLLILEFQAQVNEEADLSLPVTKFMLGLDRPTVFLKNELGFYSAIVKPLWECLNMWLSPGLDLALKQLNLNIEKLTEMYKDADRKANS